jgi:hypothetical protein
MLEEISMKDKYTALMAGLIITLTSTSVDAAKKNNIENRVNNVRKSITKQKVLINEFQQKLELENGYSIPLNIDGKKLIAGWANNWNNWVDWNNWNDWNDWNDWNNWVDWNDFSNYNWGNW